MPPERRFLKRLQPATMTAVLIGLVTLIVFLPALRNGFVNWDDNQNLVNNPYFRGFSWDHLKWMWTNQLTSRYVPLTWMTFALDYVIWGNDPLGYHLTSVLLHAANAAIFFLVSLAIFRRSWVRTDSQTDRILVAGAAFAALFFSLHPLRVESVAWATERRDVLSGLFYLLAVLVYVRAFPAKPGAAMPRKSYLVCLLLFVAAMLSKEIVVTLPVILLILDVYPLRRLGGTNGWFSRTVWSVWLEKIPFFVLGLMDGVLAIYGGLRSHLVEPVAVLGWTARIAITVYGMAFYLMKTIAPIHLSPLYMLTRSKTALSGLPLQLSLAVVLLVTLVCFDQRRKHPSLLAAWTACAITLLPVSGIIHNGLQIAADRYTYLSCLGLALVAGGAFSLSWRSLQHSSAGKAFLASAALLVLITWGWLSRAQIGVWRDSDTLWTQALAVEPSFVAHMNLAASLFNEGHSTEAIDQYRQAVAMWPENAGLHILLGATLLDAHRGQEAASEFRIALQRGPNPDALRGLTRALLMQGKLEDAIGVLREALLRDPGDTEASKNLDIILRMQAHQPNR